MTPFDTLTDTLRVDSTTKYAVHDRRGLRGRLLLQVSVEIRGDSNVGVSEELRHLDEFNAGGDEKAGGAVSQVMKTYTRQIRFLQQSMGDTQNIARVKCGADAHVLPFAVLVRCIPHPSEYSALRQH